jgi:hydroxyethylthiazole kinase-like uncharacterized protein yjeF
VRRAHTVAQVRAAEDALRATLPPGTLMQRAAAGLAVVCAQRLGRVYGSRVHLLVGGGDNGADALWAGARLARRGAAVTATLAAEPAADALAALTGAGGRVTDHATDHVPPGALVVDGLVGIGGRGALRPRAATLVEQACGHDVVAVDLPSGVDADTGEVAGVAVTAALTVTFGTVKPGLLLARQHTGQVLLVDIGLQPHLPDAVAEQLEPADVAARLPRPARTADKYSRGVVGVAAGSQQYTGAAVLAVGAAVRAGAGMVRFAGAPHAAEQVRSRWPEVVVSEHGGADVVEAGRVQAWLAGPGLGSDAVAAATVEAVLAQDVPVLLDADALTLAAQHPEWVRRRTAPTLLTPHDREFARFGPSATESFAGGPVAAARRLAADLGAVVLLKGDATVVTGADGPARVNGTGSAALATAGTGDVLAGACGALLAQGLAPLDAASVAAHLHGRAAALAARGAAVSAADLLDTWHDAVREAAGGAARLPA